MTAWETCQKCFWLKYIDKVPVGDRDTYPFDYGSFIHDSIETGQLDVNDLLAKTGNFEHAEMAEIHIQKYKEMVEKLKLVNGVNEVEFSLELPHPDPTQPDRHIVLYGFFDRIEYTPQTKVLPKAIKVVLDDSKPKVFLNITAYDDEGNEIKTPWEILKMVEYKTKASKWSIREIQKSYQFSLYKYVLREIAGKDVFSQLLVFVKDKKKPDVQIERIDRDPKSLDDFLMKTRKVLDKIRKKEVNPISTCGYFSEYKSICPEFIV